MQNSIMGKMIARFEKNFNHFKKFIKQRCEGKFDKSIKEVEKAYKSDKVSSRKFVALFAALLVSANTMTGCIFTPKMFLKEETSTPITPDDTIVDVGNKNDPVDGPIQGDADIDEKPLNTYLPSVDSENNAPNLGTADKVEQEDNSLDGNKQEVELNPGKEDKEEDNLVSGGSVNNLQTNKSVKELKSSINTALDNYFTETKTTSSAKFSVSDIVFVEANNKGIDIGFTTDAGKTGGYSVITVGSALDSENVKSLVGNLTSKTYLATMNASVLEDLVEICRGAVKSSGISKNISTYYLIPITTDVSELGSLVVAYYKSFNPNSENCKQTGEGYEYSANVLIQDVNGMQNKTVSELSVSRLGKNQYYELINSAIESQLINNNKTELGL